MNVCEGTKIRHLSLLLGHLLHSIICVLETLLHLLLGSLHLSLGFLDSLEMTIIFLLLDWLLWDSWFSSESLLFHLNFLLDGSLTGHKHLLKLSCFFLCFGNGLDMLSVLINSWVLALFLLGLFFLFLGELQGLGLSLSSRHFGPWFIFGYQLSSSGGNCSGLVNVWGVSDLGLLS